MFDLVWQDATAVTKTIIRPILTAVEHYVDSSIYYIYLMFVFIVTLQIEGFTHKIVAVLGDFFKFKLTNSK